MAELLFVDDEEVLCDLARNFFTLKGHAISVAGDAVGALKLVRERDFDLAVLDINMPGPMNGVDLLREITSLKKATKVIMVTGYPTLDSATDAVRYGAYDYLLKPFDLNALAAVVDKALQDKKMYDESRRVQAVLEKYQGMLEKTMMEQIHEIRSAHEDARRAHVKTLSMLARAAEYHDDATSLHISRVGEYSALIAGRLGLPVEDQDTLRHAAPMHDVGKVGIPYQILTKPGALSAEEFDLMKEHCVIGYNIFRDEDHPYHQASGLIALTHHERWDGSGYPKSLAGEAIPLYGRIVSVVDVFDALVSQRVYKPRWPVARAVGYISEQRGAHFDPVIAQCFLDSIDEIEEVRLRIDSLEAQQIPSPLMPKLQQYAERYHNLN